MNTADNQIILAGCTLEGIKKLRISIFGAPKRNDLLHLIKTIFFLLLVFILPVTINTITAQKQHVNDSIFSVLDSLAKQQIDTDLDQALLTLEAHRKQAEKYNNLYQLALAYRNYSLYYLQQADYLNSSRYSLKSIKLAKENGFTRLMGVNYNNLGVIAMRQGDFENGKEYLEKAIAIYEQQEYKIDALSHSYQTLAAISYSEGKLDKAQQQFELGYKYALRTNNIKTLASCSNGLAALHFRKEEYQKALKGYQKALSYVRQFENGDKETAGILNNIAIVYRNMEKYDKAIETLKESLVLAKKSDSKEDIKKTYSLLNKVYKAKGDLSNALIALEYFTAYSDSIVDQNTVNEIYRLHEQFQASERKAEIEQLTNENDNLEKHAALRFTLFVVSSLLLIATLLFVYFYNRQSKLKIKVKQQELEQKALRAQMNPHFIFNSLNSIQRLYIEGKEDLANDYMADFSHLLRGILNNSGKNAISLEEEIQITELYLQLEQMRTDNQFVFTIHLSPDVHPKKLIPPLIIQPYVENAIWHGILPNKKKKGNIRIEIEQPDSSIFTCRITDNGIGYSTSIQQKENKKNTSKGMAITAQRLGGEKAVVIESKEEGGTTICLTIPIIR